jgi:hypothetical protein
LPCPITLPCTDTVDIGGGETVEVTISDCTEN